MNMAALTCAEGGNRTLMKLPSHDFESCASTSSATSAYLISFFKNSLPTPDFKYFSLCLACFLFSNCSIRIILNGMYGLVVLLYPLLCCEILLSGLSEIPV